MKIAVYGLWHLGLVTAGCLSQNNHVIGLDDDLNLINSLSMAKMPIFEPGLEELIRNNLNKNNLKFSTDKKLLREVDIVWVAFDTPVDNSDNADTDFVVDKIRSVFDFIKKETVLLISSQLPVGTTDLLRKEFQNNFPGKKVYFAYSPENLRLGKAIEAFTMQHRIVIGIDDEMVKERLTNLLSCYTNNLVWMSIKSAEMVKHSLNSFLALSISFVNEIATLCEKVGANASEVERGLKSEERIGVKSYLKPGGPFAGGTLARDVKFLSKLGRVNKIKTSLINSILSSNKNHQKWLRDKITSNVSAPGMVGIIGLSYKDGTSTLRRSSEVELCKWLIKNGFCVVAYDADVKRLPKNLSKVKLVDDLKQIFGQAKVVIVSKRITGDVLSMIPFTGGIIIDQNGFLKDLKYPRSVKYISVGISNETK